MTKIVPEARFDLLRDLKDRQERGATDMIPMHMVLESLAPTDDGEGGYSFCNECDCAPEDRCDVEHKERIDDIRVAARECAALGEIEKNGVMVRITEKGRKVVTAHDAKAPVAA